MTVHFSHKAFSKINVFVFSNNAVSAILSWQVEIKKIFFSISDNLHSIAEINLFNMLVDGEAVCLYLLPTTYLYEKVRNLLAHLHNWRRYAFCCCYQCDPTTALNKAIMTKDKESLIHRSLKGKNLKTKWLGELGEETCRNCLRVCANVCQ